MNRIHEKTADDQSSHCNSTQQLKNFRSIEHALNLTAIVAIFDDQGIITYVNDLFCEVSQYHRSELLGQNYRILNFDEYPESSFNNAWKQIECGQIWKGEIKNRKKDGTSFWVHAVIVPILNESNNPYQYIAIQSEITKQKELEEAIIKSNEKYQLIANNSVNLISLVEINGAFQYVSPTFHKILGYELPALEKGNFFDLIHPDDVEMVKQSIHTYCRKKKEPLQIEMQVRHANGDYIDVEANIGVTNNPTCSMGSELMMVDMRDIRNRKVIEQKIYHLAYHDSLTNFPNRRSFMNELRSEIMSKSKSNKRLSILFIDLDNFKSINDQWGHDVGDLVLKEVAKIIRSEIRPSDFPARLGGDEFTVMLRDVKNEQEAITITQRILEKLQSPILLAGQEHLVTCSIGVANYPEHGKSSEELLKNADDALYHVKQRGRNAFMVFNQSIENKTLERRLLETALRTAIKEQQFYLEYQPKLNITKNELIGVEALVRWNHPDLGKIPPLKFISLAEETGLIVPLGEWILRESCHQLRIWKNQGLTNLTMAVNVSVRQLEDPYFVHKVEEILKETNLHPKFLEFEVTESIFADVKNTVSVLNEIRQMGIQISVDDFGTGYSSLSYIKEFPIDTLKVDQSFVKDIHTNEESKAIVKAVLNLAKTIGINVIAEGIELVEHVEALSKDGCHFGQGYYYSRPLSTTAFEEYVTNMHTLKG